MNKILIFLINLYKVFISPLLGQNCRFYPSCSQYSRECLKKFSLPVALWYSCRRICKCHPFHPGGNDPVP
ncbi:MAG: membrane protein insertion efficiency factor YidD [Bacteriovoracaceae bacterium]